MTLKTAWAQVFGVAAILVAAMAFAPSAAQAHAGHGYMESTPAATWVEPSDLVAVVDTAAILAGRSIFDQFPHEQNLSDRVTAELRSVPDATPNRDLAVCGPGCCNGAPSHCSPALALGCDVSIMAPTGANARHLDRAALGIAGCDPEGLRKPPRTFA